MLRDQFVGIENMLTAINDTWPKLRRHKPWVALVLCLGPFLVGLTMCTQSGVYWFEVAAYSTGWSLILGGLLEFIIFGWIYTASRLLKDIEYMLGFKLYKHWWICWTILTRGFIIAIIVFYCIDSIPISLGGAVAPTWVQALLWLMITSVMIPVPIFGVVQICRSYGQDGSGELNLGQRMFKLMKPSEDWKPAIDEEESKAESSDFETKEEFTAPPPEYPGYSNPVFNGDIQSEGLHRNPTVMTRL